MGDSPVHGFIPLVSTFVLIGNAISPYVSFSSNDEGEFVLLKLWCQVDGASLSNYRAILIRPSIKRVRNAWGLVEVRNLYGSSDSRVGDFGKKTVFSTLRHVVDRIQQT